MNLSDSDETESPIVVVILDHDVCRLGTAVDYDEALTLWATMSEDPANWSEVAGYWPRYRAPTGCEFVDGLTLQFCARDVALASIEGHGNWLTIDLIQKRIFVGPNVQELGRDATLALPAAENTKRGCPLPFRLPPWWELRESATADLAFTKRESEIRVPRTNRELLFGASMIDDLTRRLFQVTADGRLPTSALDEDEAANALHALTVEVHRDWLMTIRADLAGKRPRELLHGAHDWSDGIIWGQRQRFEAGMPMTAAPDDMIGYEDAPMGREEMILYFDLCREVIAAGWFWCEKEVEANNELNFACGGDAFLRLTAFLSDVRDDWLQQPFEGGSPPNFIIECSRRRVPRGSQVPIVGMDQCQSEQHVPDCNCPICDMMASGMFGVGFTSMDGHHLDLDDEFAFSTDELIEDWDRKQQEYREFNDKFNREQAERERRIAAGERKEDVYASTWSSPMSDEPLPGDSHGYLKLSFRLAEIIGDLESTSAPQEMIRELNASFRKYRESEAGDRLRTKAALRTELDSVAGHYPELTSKVADFQSLVDEMKRASWGVKSMDDCDDSRFQF